MAARIKSGWRVGANGKLVKVPPKLNVSARLRQATSKRIKVMRGPK